MRNDSRRGVARAALFSGLACAVIVLALVPAIATNAQPGTASPRPAASAQQLPPGKGILVGAAWYPEQWPESRWNKDLELMQQAHIRVVRVGEFAWSRMEPSEGNFHFGWLERAIAMAARHGIVTVIGTPTAAPPVWMATKYPDILSVRPDGRREGTGNRAEGSVNSPVYLKFCARIARQLAMHFGHNPNVVGWQIDNEDGYATMSYDARTRRQFDAWLRAKYKTIAALNRDWTTAYWSQTYDNFSEIPIPIGPHNPALMLEWKRFVTRAWRLYLENQIRQIRRYAGPKQFITTNFMGFFVGQNYYRLAEPLTMAAWDDYVGSGHVKPAYNAMSHDFTRGLKRKNFWVMETQPGAVDWAAVNNALYPGEIRAMAWQAIGHGANAVLYWQWRSALNGQEEYHGTLIGPDGTPVPMYNVARKIGAEFAKVGEAFRGTTPASRVALLYSYDSRWAIDFQRFTDRYHQMSVLASYYRALDPLAQSIDVIQPSDPLGQYKLVVAPDLNVLPEPLARHLLDYVKNGGDLVLGPRSGMKNQFNALLTQRQPGYLAAPLGGRVAKYYALLKDVPVSGAWGNGKASVWAERMAVLQPGTQVVMRYGQGNPWLAGHPAVITRRYGKGRITYIGAILDSGLMRAAAEWMVKQSGVKPVFGPVPEGVWVSRRVGEGKEIFVVINYAKQARDITLPRPMESLLAGERVSKLSLRPYGVAVLEVWPPTAGTAAAR